MKKKLITFSLLLSLLTYSNAQKPVATFYDWNKIHPHEVYSINSTGQKTGAYKEYDQSGVVIKEYNYLNGLENGPCIDYASTGNNQRAIKAKATFKNGQPEGYYVEYCRYTDYKEKIQEGQYKNGKKTGLWKEWWCDDDTRGILKSEGSYDADNQNGEWKTYARNGSILTKGSYSNGYKKEGMWYYYSSIDSAKPISWGKYLNNVKVGPWRIMLNSKFEVTDNQEEYAVYRTMKFDSTGIPSAEPVIECHWSGEKVCETHLNPAGKREGKETWYYRSGKVSSEGTRKNGIWVGDYIEYYESGAVEIKGKRNDTGNIQGEWKTFYESGKVKVIEEFSEGYSTTLLKKTQYNENGDIIKEETF